MGNMKEKGKKMKDKRKRECKKVKYVQRGNKYRLHCGGGGNMVFGPKYRPLSHS
jgi:hypothetical protein